MTVYSIPEVLQREASVVSNDALLCVQVILDHSLDRYVILQTGRLLEDLWISDKRRHVAG
jgi:hypothetical protein